MKILDIFKKKKELTRQELRGKALEAKLEIDEIKEDDEARKFIQQLEDLKNKDKKPSKFKAAIESLNKFANQFEQRGKPKGKKKGIKWGY